MVLGLCGSVRINQACRELKAEHGRRKGDTGTEEKRTCNRVESYSHSILQHIMSSVVSFAQSFLHVHWHRPEMARTITYDIETSTDIGSSSVAVLTEVASLHVGGSLELLLNILETRVDSQQWCGSGGVL